MANLSDWINMIGLPTHYPEMAKAGDYALLSTLMGMIDSPDSYCLVGGGAVVSYVGMGERKISPDVDVLITVEALRGVAQKARENKGISMRANTHGLTFQQGSFEVDFLVATKRHEREAVQNAKVRNDIRVILPEYLLLMKTLVGREKDINDVTLLINKLGADVVSRARSLFKRYAPNEREDFDSLCKLANILAMQKVT